MKFDIKYSRPEFEPITLTLTIESEGELAELAARLNMSRTTVLDDQSHRYKIPGGSTCYSLWDALDRAADLRGLVKS